MANGITPEKLATRVCHALRLAPRDHSENLAEILRTALADTRAAAVAATKTVCLEIAEDEAERCRAIGAAPAEQMAMTIAGRIRRRHVEVLQAIAGPDRAAADAGCPGAQIP